MCQGYHPEYVPGEVVPYLGCARLFHVDYCAPFRQGVDTSARATHCYNIKWVLNYHEEILLDIHRCYVLGYTGYIVLYVQNPLRSYIEVFKSLLVGQFWWFLADCCATGYWDGHHNDNDRVRDCQVDFHLDDILTLMHGLGIIFFGGDWQRAVLYSILLYFELSEAALRFTRLTTKRPCWKAQLQSKSNIPTSLAMSPHSNLTPQLILTQ